MLMLETEKKAEARGWKGTEGGRKKDHHQQQQTLGSTSGLSCSFTVINFALQSNFSFPCPDRVLLTTTPNQTNRVGSAWHTAGIKRFLNAKTNA